jgi:hypothetical protein
MKVQTEIFVPVLERHFDVMLPTNVRVGECIDLINKVISDLSEGLYSGNDVTMLCDRDSGVVIDISISVEDANIKNGSRLMLI